MSRPLNRRNYGSIPHLPKSKMTEGDKGMTFGQVKILTEKTRDKHDEVFVFEKYDGSNVGIGKKDNVIYPLTRSGYHARTSPYEQYHVFADWVERNKSIFYEILNNGSRITGEWMYQAHGLKYEIKGDPILFFDLFDHLNDRISFDDLKTLSIEYKFNLPRLLHRGNAVSVDSLIEVLNKKTDNIRSEEMPEGMVYRVERKGLFDFAAKWVRNDFTPGKYIIGEDITPLINKVNQDK